MRHSSWCKCLSAAGRTDIKCDKRSNLEDIPQITPDWDKMMAEASDDAAKINQICGASNG